MYSVDLMVLLKQIEKAFQWVQFGGLQVTVRILRQKSMGRTACADYISLLTKTCLRVHVCVDALAI